jgi:hypothetical protein
VVKIENPKMGDPGRRLRPGQPDNDPYYFHVFNANKKSITVNLKSPKGLALVKDMLRKADVCVENFAPGTIERLGLGYDAVRELNPAPQPAGESNRTPAVPAAMASPAASVIGSPRKARAKIATCNTSLLEYATPSAKFRSCIVRRRRAVAAICATAPESTQPKNGQLGEGNAMPRKACTATSHSAANGKPYRKRTSVAPSVPSSAVRLRCAALRIVWANAAQIVTGIHSHAACVTSSRPRRHRLCHPHRR